MMNRQNPNHFTYDKNRAQGAFLKPEKPISKLSFLFQLFMATFIVIFIIIVVLIMKFTTKVDIEYTKSENLISNQENDIYDDEQRKIDRRLIFLQQEERMPKSAHTPLEKTVKDEIEDIKNLSHKEKLDKVHKIQEKKVKQNSIAATTTTQEKKHPLAQLKEEILKDETQTQEDEQFDLNVVIMSKVLTGRFSTFDEAKRVQALVKEKNPNRKPYVRKVGDVYSVQVGSYQDFAVAKKVAREVKSQGFDVWIYQQ